MQGTELDYWKFRDDEQDRKQSVVERYKSHQFQALEVGPWTIFHKPRNGVLEAGEEVEM